MAIIDFGGTKEEVVTREEFPMAKARKVLKNEVIAVIGYGVQGPAQGLNMKDNGFKVVIGQSRKFEKDWNRACEPLAIPRNPCGADLRSSRPIQQLNRPA